LNKNIVKSEFTFSLIQMSEDKKLIENIVGLNAKANNFGLTITENIAREISFRRKEALKENERFEPKSGAVTRLISAFLETRYINQEDFAYVIGEIIDIFYFLKTETENSIPDDDLISEMFNVFTYSCFGSLEQMQSKGIEKILREYKLDDRGNKWNDTEIWDDKVWDNERPIYREELIGYEEDWRE